MYLFIDTYRTERKILIILMLILWYFKIQIKSNNFDKSLSGFF